MRSLVVLFRRAVLAFACVALVGCTGTPTRPPAGPEATEAAQPAPGADEAKVPGRIERRSFAPTVGGEAVLAGISYGPFREGQRPGGPLPTDEQILEDLRIIAPRWHLIRFYSSADPGEAILRAIKDNDLPIRVLAGAWISPDADEANAAEVAGLIRLANAYPEVVAGVSVGNETQVSWSGHRSSAEKLIEHIRTVRAAVAQPVTTADDYNFWNKPESHAVANEVDFLLLHAYAMWNGKTLENAVPWTAQTIRAIAAEHPDLKVVIGETGWATELDPEGSEVQHIKAPAGEAEQKAFYTAWTTWAATEKVPYFYFEAFDEPWKGSDRPKEVEKHWGLYNVDRTPKAAVTAP